MGHGLCPCTTTETECVVPSPDGNIVTDSEEASLCISLVSSFTLKLVFPPVLFWQHLLLYFLLFKLFFPACLPLHPTFGSSVHPTQALTAIVSLSESQTVNDSFCSQNHSFSIKLRGHTFIESGTSSEKTNQPKFCLTTL